MAIIPIKLYKKEEQEKIKEVNWADTERFRIQNHLPGVSVFVSINGQTVYRGCHGLSDIENGTKMNPLTAVRIASISKSFTSLLISKLVEQKKLSLTDRIQKYIEFPEKESEVTVEGLLSHTSGLRHYCKQKDASNLTDEEKAETEKEFQSCIRYQDAHDASKVFRDDPLVVPKGKFHYTTYGYTVLEDILETITGKKFEVLLSDICKEIGLVNTNVDKPESIIQNRARGYRFVFKDPKKVLADYDKGNNLIIQNSPPVDVSNKYAGGGIISTGPDLLKFGNCILYAMQYKDGIISSDTMKQFRFGNGSENSGKRASYGYGFDNQSGLNKPWLENHLDAFGHTGGAIDASSIMRIYPCEKTEEDSGPRGIVVVILTNTYGISCRSLAEKIASNYLS